MEKVKTILEKIIKIIIIAGSIMGIISTVLLFRFHIKNWPIHISFHPQEILLFLCLIGIFLLAIRFKVKYFKWLAMGGLILSVISLVILLF